ncbi:MAG: glycosyltransferase family 39 protein [Planctomycetes bacterium]|nr:glycosyltransferase family 39 protein [Planctomycetota bacterium]
MGAKRSEPTDGKTPAPRGRLGPLLLLLILPLALRLAPVEHGLPRSYVPDTHGVRAALGMVRDKDPFPPVGRYSTYPNLFPYSLIPAYGAVFVGGLVLGEWENPEEYGEALLDNATLPNLIARLVVVWFGALTTWVVFKTARAAGMGVGAWCAAWLIATSCLHMHLSVHERPWAPMVFFQSLSLWAAVKFVKSSKPAHLIACSVAAGLAFACHQSGLGTFALCGFAWLFALKEGVGGQTPGQRFLVGFGAFAAGLVAAVLLGHPYLLLHGDTPAAAVVGGDSSDFSIGGQGIILALRWESVTSLLSAFLSYDPVLVIAGLAGVLSAWRRTGLRPVCAFAALWGLFFLTQQNDHVRYLLPLTVLFALFAGSFIEGRWKQGAAGFGTLLLLGLPLLQAVRFVQVLQAPDVRAEAEARLAELPSDTLVAIDRYGPAADLDRDSLELLSRLREARGDTLRTRERWRVNQLDRGDAGQGVRGLFVEELMDFNEREGTVHVRPEYAGEGTTPGALLRGLGVTHVLLVDRISGDGSANLLAPVLGETREVWELGPWREGCAPGEARLPHELQAGVRTLWSVEQAGPQMQLVELLGA